MNRIAVVTPYTNTRRFKIRKKLYDDFKAYISSCGLDLFTVELVIGDRDFEVTESNNPFHVQLRGDQEFWFKENLQNIAVARLPRSYDTIFFIDCDCIFVRPDWVQETMHQLDHYPVVQMWSHYLDVGPDFQTIRQPIPGFAFVYNTDQDGVLSFNDFETDGCGQIIGTRKVRKPKKYGAPGLAWAWRRKDLDEVGGLLDTCIIGSGDHHMAHGMIGEMNKSINIADGLSSQHLTNGYHRTMMRWGERAFKVVKGDIGYVPTMAVHSFHGKKVNRGYGTRWRILTENKFNPEIDLHRNTQGLLILNRDKVKMIREIRQYFSSRNEDSIEL